MPWGTSAPRSVGSSPSCSPTSSATRRWPRGLDPEQVKNLVDGCFERLVADVVAFGGRVDKIIGDAIVALFGAPVAHEDDAERAVRAALRMQGTLRAYVDSLGLGVQMRIGVNTGEVLVGALRAGGDYTAMGDVVNAAERLQTAAPPGGILVGPGTRGRHCRRDPLRERRAGAGPQPRGADRRVAGRGGPGPAGAAHPEGEGAVHRARHRTGPAGRRHPPRREPLPAVPRRRRGRGGRGQEPPRARGAAAGARGPAP